MENQRIERKKNQKLNESETQKIKSRKPKEMVIKGSQIKQQRINKIRKGSKDQKHSKKT